MVETLPNPNGRILVQYHPTATAICSVSDKPFTARIDITYSPADCLLEFESFEGWLATLQTERMTIEGMSRLVFDTLRKALGDIELAVTVHGETAVHAPASATVSNFKEARDER